MDDLSSESPTIASAPQRAGVTFAERYELLARLGRGAVKEVWLAHDKPLDREVALAIFVGIDGNDAVARERIKREAQVTARLHHQNIITVHEWGESDGLQYLVLQPMKGGSLADRLARTRPAIAEAVRIAREIALALAHAHAHGVVHRDVKPDNVWLTDDGHAALGDFGIAQQAGLDRLTHRGSVLGTPRYLSPEQIVGDAATPASDLYALGVTLYELVTGRPPFAGRDPRSQHLAAVAVPPSQHEPAVPPHLERLIEDLLAKSPADRPPSAAAVAAELAAIERQAPTDDGATGRPAAPPSERTGARQPAARRVVSVLAATADIDDPEALHLALDRCRAVIERHGGTPERYPGDCLVGFFGLGESRGDDALRATRAAIELRTAAPALRLGIESGELYLGTGPNGATIATGGAIKTAGRLAEHAGEGEILLGEQIRRSVDVTVDETSGRLLALASREPTLLRPAHTPFVGRGPELDQLRAAFERTRDERLCRVVTVAGPPGIGKSRLVAEFLTRIAGDATVLAGRCLAHGEGTAYRALADVVRGLGEDPRARVEELLAGDEQAVHGILGAAGLAHEPAQLEETAWALRRLFERLGRDRPLVVAFEDIHWAQHALLDLLDHVIALSSGAPILLVCLTRPELLELRPEWAAPQPNRSVIVLDALGERDAHDLAERLGAGELAARIADRAEGNPLFVEQLVAVDPRRQDELPASIQAVLAARIDALEPAQRMLLQHAAVEGRTFHLGALRSLLPEGERRGIDATIVALARKSLVGSDRSEFPGEDAFRFRHVLIREAAYDGLPKLLRAELHAGVADWLDTRAADEIVAFHLEQACTLAAELGEAGERERGLAERAVERFEAAADAALGRADPAAACALLERAVALVAGDDAARCALLPALGASLFEAGRMTEATDVLEEAIRQAPDPRLKARARIEREFVRLETEPSSRTEESRKVTDDVLPVLEREADEHGQSRAWSLRAQLAWSAGLVERADDAWRRAAERAERSGDERELLDIVGWRATAAAFGPTHVDEAIRRCEEFRRLAAASPVAVMWMLNPLAHLHAMRGDFELAESLLLEANETRGKLGDVTSMVSHHEAEVRLLAGQAALAESSLRASAETLEPVSDGRMLATTNAMLAQAVYALQRPQEAGELCRMTAAAAADDDIVTQVIWRGVQAKVFADAGRCDQAEALAREAVALVRPTDLLSHHGTAMLDLGQVLTRCGRDAEAARAVRAALSLFEAKGNAVAAARAREQLHTGKG